MVRQYMQTGKKRFRTSVSKTPGRSRAIATQTTFPMYQNVTYVKKGPLPLTLKTTMVYHETFDLNPGAAGTNAVYIFSANGLYDPNITAIGHQPRGFDQLMALYDHFVVIGVKATLTTHNLDASKAQIVGMAIVDNSTSLGSANIQYMELRTSKSRLVGPYGDQSTTSVAIACDPNKFLGRSKPLSDPELKGSASANPTEQAYIHCFGFPQDASTDTGAMNCRITLEYTAVLIEPKQPTSS